MRIDAIANCNVNMLGTSKFKHLFNPPKITKNIFFGRARFLVFCVDEMGLPPAKESRSNASSKRIPYQRVSNG